MSVAAYVSRAELMEASTRLEAHLNTLSPERVSAIYADGSTQDEDGTCWDPAPEAWVDLGGVEAWYFVDSSGAAAHYTSGRWVGIDPGEDILSDQGVITWGTEGFGYPAPTAGAERGQ